MLKLNDNPPLTWPDTRIRNFNGTWMVAYCKSRNEKALAWDMVHKKISYFLPMSLNVHKRNRKTVRTLLPLFLGYVFFCGDEPQRLEVLRTNRVVNIIKVQDQAQLVQELEAIEKALIASFALQSWQQFGKDCSNIIADSLDAQGQIVHIKGKTYLVLPVSVLGLTTSIEITSCGEKQIDMSYARI